jgi:hypothetical protein
MAALVAAQEKGLLLRAWEIHQPLLLHKEITGLLVLETLEVVVVVLMRRHLHKLVGQEDSRLLLGLQVHMR